MRKWFLFVTSLFSVLFAEPFVEEVLRDYPELIMDPKEASEIYYILKVVDVIFENANIPYWIEGGTLLGAARHQGIIPWDKDADIQVPVEYKQAVKDLRSEFAKFGVQMTFFMDIIKFKLENKRLVDLFFMVKIGDGKTSPQRLHYESMIARMQFSRQYFLAEEIRDPVRRTFGPIALSAPSQYTRYLTHSYGEDVFSHASIFSKSGIPSKRHFPISDFHPVVYDHEVFRSLVETYFSQ